MTETQITMRDLTGEVTAEQYRESLQKMWDGVFLLSRYEHASWCSDWVWYMHGISSDFPSDPGTRRLIDNGGEVEVPPPAEREDYAEALREIRARFLWHVNHQTGGVTLDEINKVLEDAGVPGWNGRQLFVVTVPPVWVRSGLNSGEIQNRIVSALTGISDVGFEGAGSLREVTVRPARAGHVPESELLYPIEY